jgi:hypothetical protein
VKSSSQKKWKSYYNTVTKSDDSFTNEQKQIQTNDCCEINTPFFYGVGTAVGVVILLVIWLCCACCTCCRSFGNGQCHKLARHACNCFVCFEEDRVQTYLDGTTGVPIAALAAQPSVIEPAVPLSPPPPITPPPSAPAPSSAPPAGPHGRARHVW